MEELKTLKPAETLFILKKGKITHKEYYKATLIDLLLKGVLQLTEVEQSGKNRETRTYPYIEPGIHFDHYKPVFFEKPFLFPFMKDKSIRFLYKNYITISTGRNFNYWKAVSSSPALAPYVTVSFFDRIFHTCSLTDEGHYLYNKLPDNMTAEPYEGIIDEYAGNMGLLANFNLDFIEELSGKIKYKPKPELSDPALITPSQLVLLAFVYDHTAFANQFYYFEPNHIYTFELLYKQNDQHPTNGGCGGTGCGSMCSGFDSGCSGDSGCGSGCGGGCGGGD
jgi:hypothetical protein